MTCKGMNCTYDPPEINDHSLECEAQHAAAIAGGTFIKWSVALTDAKRYQWLREQPDNTEAPRIDVVQWSQADGGNDGVGLRLEALDKAIDAAIEAHITGEKTE